MIVFCNKSKKNLIRSSQIPMCALISGTKVIIKLKSDSSQIEMDNLLGVKEGGRGRL